MLPLPLAFGSSINEETKNNHPSSLPGRVSSIALRQAQAHLILWCVKITLTLNKDFCE